MDYQDTLDFARSLDEKDPLGHYRDQFYFPRHNGKKVIYFCGNSLGLQPKTVRAAVEQELKDWEDFGVEGHFHGKNPWFYYQHFFTEQTAELVGAKTDEVVVMNTLTTNLHLMMVSFYRPTETRYKIMIEEAAFPSDHYAVETQIRFHGFDPAEALIELIPRGGEDYLRTEDILEAIADHGDQLALVMLGGVNYYTGQFFDLPAITESGHRAGAQVGFDLAHACGNLPLKLHDWDIDFAVWCSYKYLNSGPGGPSGVFIHRKHGKNPEIPRFAGWWGYDEATRFQMKKGFVPREGAMGWMLSNDQVLGMAAHKAALAIFHEAGMEALRSKSILLTGYLEYMIGRVNQFLGKEQFRVITPKDSEQRGCQLSIIAAENGKAFYDDLTQAGVVADWREPDVIRVAPVPLYNTFEEVFEFARILKEHQAGN